MNSVDITAGKLQDYKMRLAKEAAAFHRDFDATIDEVCKNLLVIPQQCGLDHGPGGGGGGPFFCHAYGRPEGFMTAQHFLSESLRHLKETVDPINPHRLERFISYGDGKHEKCLYNDGTTYIAWVEKSFLRPLKQNAREIADRYQTVKQMPEDMKTAIRAYGILDRKLVKPWKLHNRLQRTSQLLAALAAHPPLPVIRTSEGTAKPARLPKKIPGGARRLESFVAQLTRA